MLLDIIVAVAILLAIVKGLSKGFIVGVFSLLAFIIGLAAALKLSLITAGYLGNTINVSKQWLPIIAFALVFILVVFLVNLGAKVIEGAVRLMLLGWLNRLAGALLYALLYLFILSVLLFYADSLKLISRPAAEASVTYPYLRALGPRIIDGIGVVLPFFKDMFASLGRFFAGIA
jgi:membrane protein required for colicin V production